jgi:hypothetical protein
MKKTLWDRSKLCLLVVLGIISIGCTTINELDNYSFEKRTIAVWLRQPPEPEISVTYNIYLNEENVVGSIVSVGSNVIKASEVAKAEKKMEAALSSIDVPELMKVTAISACANVLGCRTIEDPSDADYILDIEIEKYGIDAGSPGGHVFFTIDMNVHLYETTESETIWRRDIDHGESLTPYIWGIDNSVGNVVTAGVLAELTVDEIAEAFIELSEEAGKEIARQLEGDFLKARYKKK